MLRCWAGRSRCLRLEASRYPPLGSKQREEVAWASSPSRLSTLLPQVLRGDGEPSLPWQSPRLCPRLEPLGSPDPSVWSSWKSLGCLTSTSNPTCPTQTLSWLPMFFWVFSCSPFLWCYHRPPGCSVTGRHCAPCPVPVACQPAVLVWAPSPFTAVGDGG